MGLVSLELKLISCRHLKAFNLFQKLSVYAVVSITSKTDEGEKIKEEQQQKTPVDEESGSNPEWNHLMQFDLKHVSLKDKIESNDLFLKIKLRCAGVLYGKRSIGEVYVPLKDLIDEFNGSIRYVSYQVRTNDGKANGVLNFSYKVKKDDEEEDLPCKPTTRNHFSPEKLPVKKQEKRLYPSLDDVQSPVQIPNYYTMPPIQAFVYHPCPSPLVHSAGPYWYATQPVAAAGYEYSNLTNWSIRT